MIDWSALPLVPSRETLCDLVLTERDRRAEAWKPLIRQDAANRNRALTDYQRWLAIHHLVFACIWPADIDALIATARTTAHAHWQKAGADEAAQLTAFNMTGLARWLEQQKARHTLSLTAQSALRKEAA